MTNTKERYKTFRNLIKKNIGKEMVVVCIGTDRSTGDSLGPLVGTLLKSSNLKNIEVYGTLEEPIHAINLEESIKTIKHKHQNAFIIGVDACLGKQKNIGNINIADGPVKPGAGVDKNLPPVGDMHVTGVVNVSGFMEFFVLQNTRLSLVMKLAKEITNIVCLADKYLTRKIKNAPMVRQHHKSTKEKLSTTILSHWTSFIPRR